jgi:hypothetical protein
MGVTDARRIIRKPSMGYGDGVGIVFGNNYALRHKSSSGRVIVA